MEKDRHHILASSVGWATVPKNLILLDKIKHNAWHILYGNRTPIQAILKEFDEKVSRVLDIDLFKDLTEPIRELAEDETHIYQRGVMIPKKYKDAYIKFDTQQEYRNK